MTYNVRGPLDTGVRAWPNRKAAVIERILANNADLVGVQEAQHPSGGPDVPADLIAGLTVTGKPYGVYNPGGDGTPSASYARLDYIFHNGGALTSAAPSIDRTESGGNTPSDHFAVLATLRPSLFAAGSTLSLVPSGASTATQLFFADVTGDGCADRISWNPTVGEGETWVAKSNCASGPRCRARTSSSPTSTGREAPTRCTGILRPTTETARCSAPSRNEARGAQ
jgi:hypothetical protein